MQNNSILTLQVNYTGVGRACSQICLRFKLVRSCNKEKGLMLQAQRGCDHHALADCTRRLAVLCDVGTQFPDPLGGFWQVTDPINISIGPPNASFSDQMCE